jgi:transcription elongation factor Elf1
MREHLRKRHCTVANNDPDLMKTLLLKTFKAHNIVETFAADATNLNVIEVKLISAKNLMRTFCGFSLEYLRNCIKAYTSGNDLNDLDGTAVVYGFHIGTVQDLTGNDVNDLSAIVHEYTCAKYAKKYQHNGDDDSEVKTGFDCPLCHPEKYSVVAQELGENQALVKCGSTKSSVKRRYQKFVDMFTT